MPQLSSGRHVGLDPSPLHQLLDRACDGIDAHELMALEAQPDLFAYINVLYFRQDAGGRSYQLADQSTAPPVDLEPYPSGYDLTSIQEELCSWSSADRHAFVGFLNEERTNAFLEGLLAIVRDEQENLLQQPASIPGLLATWWKMGIHPLQDSEADRDPSLNAM